MNKMMFFLISAVKLPIRFLSYPQNIKLLCGINIFLSISFLIIIESFLRFLSSFFPTNLATVIKIWSHVEHFSSYFSSYLGSSCSNIDGNLYNHSFLNDRCGILFDVFYASYKNRFRAHKNYVGIIYAGLPPCCSASTKAASTVLPPLCHA